MESKTKPRIDVHVRWMIRRDMPEVLKIESACFEHSWSEDDFVRRLRQRNVIGMVVEYKDEVVAFMAYELHKDVLHILRTSIAMVVASTSLASSIDMLGTVMLLRPLGEELSKKLAMIVFDELEKICKDEME